MPAGTKYPGRLHAHCHRCGFNAWPDDVQAELDAKAVHEQEKRHERLSPFGHKLLRQCTRPLVGTARAYLQARECVLPPDDGDLYCHSALPHKPSGTVAPALVALVTDAVTGEPLTLHRTWVRSDGTKAPFERPRMLLPRHRKAGGAVRLWPDEAVSHGLAIAEGVETALSLAHAFAPVWACLDAQNLAAFPVLGGIECLTIAADNDEAGRDAADACARRWHAAGREVRIVMAPEAGADLNDLAREAA
ncbi:MAG: toprim domain-containing protein [Rubrivivax sp.]|nr:toprim domain-containing protein [Rubrivivax sp.]